MRKYRKIYEPKDSNYIGGLVVTNSLQSFFLHFERLSTSVIVEIITLIDSAYNIPDESSITLFLCGFADIIPTMSKDQQLISMISTRIESTTLCSLRHGGGPTRTYTKTRYKYLYIIQNLGTK